MAESQQVTLVSPSGQVYTTDDAAEINTLVSSYGYTRRSQDTAPGGHTSRQRAPKSAPKSSPAPEPAAEEPTPPETSTGDQ